MLNFELVSYSIHSQPLSIKCFYRIHGKSKISYAKFNFIISPMFGVSWIYYIINL